jgi:hypothetical protein
VDALFQKTAWSRGGHPGSREPKPARAYVRIDVVDAKKQPENSRSEGLRRQEAGASA